MAFKPKVDKIELENPDSDIVAIIDGDYPVYSVAAVGDDPYILVTHIKSGKVKEFKNKTEFQGRSRKVIGGWLGELNAEREHEGQKPFALEDFSIEQKKRRKVEYDDDGDPLPEYETDANIFHSAKTMILACLNALGAGSYRCYHGGSGKYRLNESTLLEYKGNRKDLEKPLMFEDVRDYIVKRFKSEKVEGDIETDDRVVMECYQKPNHVVVGVDKDFRGQPIKFFDANNPDEGIIDGDCFGELVWLEDKKKVSGRGRIFLYWQILCGDSTDNYKTNCFSEIKWADKGAYDVLARCKDDGEAWEVIVRVFKELYPEPIEVQGWRCQEGETIKIDWLYVLREMFTMARMLRYPGDEKTTLEDWLKELKLKPKEILK